MVQKDLLKIIYILITIILLSILVARSIKGVEFFLFFESLAVTSTIFNFLVTDENMLLTFPVFKKRMTVPSLISLLITLVVLCSIILILKIIFNDILSLDYRNLISYNILLMAFCVLIKIFDRRIVESYDESTKKDIGKELKVGLMDYWNFVPIAFITAILILTFRLFNLRINLNFSIIFFIASILFSKFYQNKKHFL